MDKGLDHWLRRLEQAPTDRSLSDLEGSVLSEIASRQRAAPATAIWGWRSAAAAVVLAIGVIAAGTSSVEARSDLALFSSDVALAPSTLLGEPR